MKADRAYSAAMSEQTPSPVETDSSTPAEALPPIPSAETATPAAAAAPVAPAPYPFSVLRVLGTALRIAQVNFVPFVVLALVLEVPAILLQLGGATEEVILAFIVSMIVSSFTQAVVAYGVIMELQGSRPSTSTCIRTGFGQLGRVLGVSLLTGLAIGAAMLLFIIPGIIVALMLYVVVPVTLVEGLGVRAAMKRSRELTHGRKGDLFLISILGGVASASISYFVHSSGLGREAAVLVQALTSAVTTMFFAVTVGVAYVELRKLRDGLQIPEIAAAFARIRK